MDENDNPTNRVSEIVNESWELREKLAGAWGLTAAELSEALAPGRELTASQIFAASDALDVPAAYIACQPGATRGLRLSLRIGQYAETGTPASTLDRATTLLEDYKLLLSWLDTPSPLQDGVDLPRGRFAIGDGRRAARRVRAILHRDSGPLNDLIEIVEKTNSIVTHEEMPEGLHGINARDSFSNRSLRVIIVNKCDSWTRQRYTLAHELCHTIYDDAGQLIVDRIGDTDALEEIRANSFARHFLLPEEDLKREFEHARAHGISARNFVASVMVEYGVSRDVTLRALTDDALVPADHPAIASISTSSVLDLMHEAGLLTNWQFYTSEVLDDGISPNLSSMASKAHALGFIHEQVLRRVHNLH